MWLDRGLDTTESAVGVAAVGHSPLVIEIQAVWPKTQPIIGLPAEWSMVYPQGKALHRVIENAARAVRGQVPTPGYLPP